MGACGAWLHRIGIATLYGILYTMKLPVKSEDVPATSFFGDAISRMSNFMVLSGLDVVGHRITECEEDVAEIRDCGGIYLNFTGKNIAEVPGKEPMKNTAAPVLA